MRFIKKEPLAFAVCAAYLLFAFVQSFCMVLGGDDVWWAAVESPSDLFGVNNINGRYLTNLLTWAICNSSAARVCICTALLFSLFVLMILLLRRKEVKLLYTAVFAAFINFSLPPLIVQTTTNWASGITNYVTSLIFTFLFLYFCKPVFHGNMLGVSYVWSIYTLVLGFLGAFCIENISAYNILIAIFVIVYCFARYKKTHPAFFTFLTGAVLGMVIMLLNDNYSSIYSDRTDSIGQRHFEFGFEEVYSTLFRNIIPNFAKPFFVIHILIAFCFVMLYQRRFGQSNSEKPKKYAVISLVCVVCFAAYSLFTSFVTDFAVFNSNYRIRGVETAFLFLYFISLLYLGFTLLGKGSFLRFAFYVISVITVTAPFLVVNPVTPRCFYAAFIFWCMASGELLLTYIGSRRASFGKTAERSLLAAVIAFTAMFMFINISNKYVDELRKKYFSEQYNSGEKIIQIISLPYPEYAVDSYYKSLTKKNGEIFPFKDRSMGYAELTLLYIDDDIPFDEACERQYMNITTQDYYESKNE